MEMKELLDLTPEELQKKEALLRKELFNLRFQHASGRAESPARLHQVRRDIARVKTVFNAKRKEASAEKTAADMGTDIKV
jgi:large subunit ribosomal protein L29